MASASLFTLFIFTLAAFSAIANHLKHNSRRKSPVILVPGLGGSQLEAKLDITEKGLCQKKTDDYVNIYLDLTVLLINPDCWVNNMRLIYDNVTRTTKNSPGVDVRVSGFGNTSGIEWVTPHHAPNFTAYFKDIVNALVAIGYSRDVNVKGAPYDFRRAPNEMADYFRSVKTMTEDLYTNHENTPVTLICHSMGCPVTWYFLNNQTQEWKNTYVKTLLSLSGAWGGAVKALQAYEPGVKLPETTTLPVRTVLRTFPSLAYMVPSDAFWNKTEVLVQTAEKNYTLGNLHDFFDDIGVPDGWEMYKDTYNLIRSLTPPGVEVHCMYGIKKKTVERLIYENGKFPDGRPIVVNGDGDGTVNLRSLQGCLRFQDHQKQKVYHTTLPHVNHTEILSNKKALEHIQDIVQAF